MDGFTAVPTPVSSIALIFGMVHRNIRKNIPNDGPVLSLAVVHSTRVSCALIDIAEEHDVEIVTFPSNMGQV